jgi:hypothetical protein
MKSGYYIVLLKDNGHVEKITFQPKEGFISEEIAEDFLFDAIKHSKIWTGYDYENLAIIKLYQK